MIGSARVGVSIEKRRRRRRVKAFVVIECAIVKRLSVSLVSVSVWRYRLNPTQRMQIGKPVSKAFQPLIPIPNLGIVSYKCDTPSLNTSHTSNASTSDSQPFPQKQIPQNPFLSTCSRLLPSTPLPLLRPLCRFAGRSTHTHTHALFPDVRIRT